MSITLWQALSNRAEQMAQFVLQGVTSRHVWEKLRPERHREFMRCLGLDPLPARCDLRVSEHGKFSGPGYVAKRISFQMLEHCWSSANLYYPDPLPSQQPGPGVLYVCGHGKIGAHHYQQQAIAWARRGYVCLILDTIEQHENTGEHHGATMGHYEQWLSLGYTAAGAEVWNAMRAMDVISAEPGVDPKRIGIVGVSGGGACSFHTAVADERFAAVSTLAGICSPRDGITHRHIDGHCDCMFPINHFGRDIADYAALIAPRAGLFCFTEHDNLYHVQENRDMVARAKPAWDLLGVSERCRIVTAPGPHGHHPVLDAATHQWFDLHLAGEQRPQVQVGEREHDEPVMSVFNGQPPVPNRMDVLPGLLTTRGGVRFAESAEKWPQVRRQAIDALLERVPGIRIGQARGTLAADGRWKWYGERELVTHRGQIDGQAVMLNYGINPQVPERVVVSIAGAGESIQHAMVRVGSAGLHPQKTITASFETRLAGFNAMPAPVSIYPHGTQPSPMHTTLLRAMALVGTTPVTMAVQDLSVLVDYLQTLDDTRGKPVYLMGRGDMAVAALYCAVQDERVAGLVLENLPSSHLDGAPVLGVLQALDIPQAVGLMAPRKVALVNPGHSFWNWPELAYQRAGVASHFAMAGDVKAACDAVMK